MANTQLLRRRIKSIKSTRQITKAMELVSAAKMRKAQNLAIKSRSYSQSAQDALAMLSKTIDKVSHPLLRKRERINKVLLIVVTSDRGLAGSYNSFVLRLAGNYIEQEKLPIDLITTGKKGQDFFNRSKKNIIASFTNLPPSPILSDIRPIINIAIEEYIKKNYDQVKIAYTKFHSTIKQEAVIENLLPFTREVDLNTEKVNEYRFEPNQEEVLNAIVPRLIDILIYQDVLESIASEHSARMVAMKNASDNAKDIIDDLQLDYNGLRQASITQELAEITAGAAAL